MAKKTKVIKVSKTSQFSAAAKNTEIKTIADRPCFAVRALRWIFITAPRAVWNWICSIELGGLCNLAMMILIIVLFSILIGQILGNRCDNRTRAAATRIPQITNNVEITEKSAPARIASVPAKKTTIVLPLRAKPKVAAQKITVIDNDLTIDGRDIASRIQRQTKINGNLTLQNMHGFTLPCGVKINGNLIVRNVRLLKFCGNFIVNGDIYVSSNSSFGAIPKNAKIRGQVIL
jgi:hypothetical protein